MIKLIILSTMLNTCEIQATQPNEIKIEAGRKRGKKQRGRRKGGNGLR